MEGNPATSEIGLRAKLFGKTKYVVIVNISCFYRCVNSRHGIGTPAIDSPAPTLTKTINSNDGWS